jgi:hypothetical protein
MPLYDQLRMLAPVQEIQAYNRSSRKGVNLNALGGSGTGVHCATAHGSTDRLVALSGLAATRSNASKVDYCFGMWQNNLKRELLWRSLRPGDRLNIAPTW